MKRTVYVLGIFSQTQSPSIIIRKVSANPGQGPFNYLPVILKIVNVTKTKKVCKTVKLKKCGKY